MAQAEALREAKPAIIIGPITDEDARGDREADHRAQRGGSPAPGDAEKILRCSLVSTRPLQGRWRAERRRRPLGVPGARAYWRRS
jgi:hypothetical protein